MKYLTLEQDKMNLLHYMNGYTGFGWPSISQTKHSDKKVKRLLSTYLVDAHKNQQYSSELGLDRFNEAVRWMNAIN